MKRISFTIVILFCTIVFTNCGTEKTPPKNSSPTITKEQYECPMKCTEEIFEKQGKCPVCEMDLASFSGG